MKECNKLILYNPYYCHMQHIEFTNHFNMFEIAGKCGYKQTRTEVCYYFKNNLSESEHKINNLVYINWFELIDNKKEVLEKLKYNGLLDFEYNHIIIEKGCPDKILPFLNKYFKIAEDRTILFMPKTFDELLLEKMDLIRGGLE